MGIFASWDITGTWLGEYGYEPVPMTFELPSKVPFTFMAEQGWFGRVYGSIQDDPQLGVLDMADVTGWISADGVTFQKQYPIFYVMGEKGRISLRESMRLHGAPMDVDVLPSPIRYVGRCDAERMLVKGTWQIAAHVIAFTSNGRPLRLPMPACSGTWSMRRKEPAVGMKRESSGPGVRRAVE